MHGFPPPPRGGGYIARFVPKPLCREGDTPSRSLPQWRYPMGSRFTLFAQDIIQRGETSEVSVLIRATTTTKNFFITGYLLPDTIGIADGEERMLQRGPVEPRETLSGKTALSG